VDVAQQGLALMHADRDEIRTGGTVVPAVLADVGFALREFDDNNLCRITGTWQRCPQNVCNPCGVGSTHASTETMFPNR
jgi:hypothetical protein